jgi:Flp pilus assembly protein CpaB
MPRRTPIRRPPRWRTSPLLALRRHPRLWWVVTGTGAVAVGLLVASVVASAEARRSEWGTTVPVVVVARSVGAGDAVTAGDVTVTSRPVALVPPSALHEVPVDAVAATDLVEGEVLVAERLLEGDLSPTAARLPPGTRAVAIPAEPGLTPPLSVGDRVDVLVALAGDEGGGGPPGFALAAGALVVAVDEHAVTVAVPRGDAPRVAVALSAGAVSLALVGAG